MGRGRDKVIKGSDLRNMSPGEVNKAFMGAIRITGTAVVRDAKGNVKYDDKRRAGSYNEDKLP